MGLSMLNSEVSGYKTAMSRKSESLPLRTILDRVYKNNSIADTTVLDYGCGKGADAKHLLNYTDSVDSYDPYWKPDGVAYVSVRRDISRDMETSRGFQRNVELDIEVLCDFKNKFCTYIIRG